MAELQHPFPPASLSGEGLEGGVAAVRFRRAAIHSELGCRRCKQRLRPSPPSYKIHNMKSVVGCLLFYTTLLACGLSTLPARAQEGPLQNIPPKDATPEEIITRFAAKETEFSKARDQYTYRQDVKVETLDGETVTGQYHEVFDVVFNDQGKRIENVVFAPQTSLEQGGLSMDQGDFEDIRHRMPFVLTAGDLPQYNILYVGQQQEDQLNCYVFDIAPKQIEGKKRYFQGRIWVDDHDFQIVKTYGKSVPDIRKKHGNEENLYPKFTTWRQQIDGLYWFPVFTRADDELHFKMQDVHIREIIKYQDYKRFGSNVKILYEGKEIPKGQKPPDQKPEEKKPDEKK